LLFRNVCNFGSGVHILQTKFHGHQQPEGRSMIHGKRLAVGAAVQIMLKGALNAVTRALAIEYAKEGIRVNTIAPGVVNTPMHKPETHDFLKGLSPAGRIGEVKEIVDAALFLTDATLTSGEILHVDGSAHAGKW
jgi:NAD(P)-dependent dehydrogenase (short-subunit alcohol dehydrogenase family)